MRFKELDDLKLMKAYEFEHQFTLRYFFSFLLILLVIDLSFAVRIWIGVVLIVIVFLSFLNYALKKYSLSFQLEQEIHRRRNESISKIFLRGD